MTQKYRERKRFLSPDVLEQAVGYVLGLAEREGVRAAVGGGFGLQLVGSPRLTADVDIVAEAPLESLPRQGPLGFGGFKSITPDGVPVNLIVRNDEFRALYEEALDKAVELEGLPVIPPEYMVPMKMVAGRPSDEADLIFLLTDVGLDMDTVRDVTRRHLGPYAVRQLGVLQAQAQWTARRGK